MQRAPGRTVTGCTVAAGGEILADRRAHQGAVGAMAVRAVIRMRVGRGAGQWGSGMTARTIGRCDLDQSRMVRGVCGMRRVPTGVVTGLAVTESAKDLTDRRTNQRTVGRTMAVRAVRKVR